jgi:biopolymer transport protein ExbD
MRRSTTLWLVLVTFIMLVVFLFFITTWARTESGQVISMDGQSLLLEVGAGKQPKQINVSVGTDTRLRINGIYTPISDLQAQVKTGDMITVRFARGSYRRAARIAK